MIFFLPVKKNLRSSTLTTKRKKKRRACLLFIVATMKCHQLRMRVKAADTHRLTRLIALHVQHIKKNKEALCKENFTRKILVRLGQLRSS